MTEASGDLQGIVDGRRLSRSVAIDDRQMRLLAYSRHYGEVDEARLSSILQRVADPESIEHVRAQGIDTAEGPVRVRAAPGTDFLARVCVPIKHRGMRLGFLWLIDADESMSEDELALAAETADEAGATMYRNSLVRQLERGRERELLRDLLAPEVGLRQLAASQLVEENLLVPGPVVALVVRGPELDDEASRVALDAALTETRRRLPARHAIHLLRHDHGLLVVSEHGRLARSDAQTAVGVQLRDDVARGAGESTPPRVGIGGRQRDLAGAAVSYEQANLAAQVARFVSSAGDVARWDDLGVYRTLAGLPAAQLTSESLDPAFGKLLAADTDGTYIGTLETYLDLAGSSKRTAEALQVHRTSVYYRLSRIEEITGLDLEDGNDRLALHLALKIARLSGLEMGPPVST